MTESVSMSEHNKEQHQQHLMKLAHDIHQSLHVIKLGTTLLKTLRNDEQQFANLCESIDMEGKQVKVLVDELLSLVSHKPDTSK